MKNGGQGASGFMAGKRSVTALSNAVVAPRFRAGLRNRGARSGPEAAGRVEAAFCVTTLTSPADFTAKSVGVYPAGSPYNIRGQSSSNWASPATRLRRVIEQPWRPLSGSASVSTLSQALAVLCRAETMPLTATQSIFSTAPAGQLAGACLLSGPRIFLSQ